jgi:hypothetical protein
MIAKDSLNAKIAENNPMYKSAQRGDLVSRTFDTVVGIFKYNIREYSGSMTVAYWIGEGLKSISTNRIMVWCKEDNRWKWIKP